MFRARHRTLRDFKNDWNPYIYVRYRDNKQVFIQAKGYDTLISHAKKRTKPSSAFYLGNDLHPAED